MWFTVLRKPYKTSSGGFRATVENNLIKFKIDAHDPDDNFTITPIWMHEILADMKFKAYTNGIILVVKGIWNWLTPAWIFQVQKKIINEDFSQAYILSNGLVKKDIEIFERDILLAHINKLEMENYGFLIDGLMDMIGEYDQKKEMFKLNKRYRGLFKKLYIPVEEAIDYCIILEGSKQFQKILFRKIKTTLKNLM